MCKPSIPVLISGLNDVFAVTLMSFSGGHSAPTEGRWRITEREWEYLEHNMHSKLCLFSSAIFFKNKQTYKKKKPTHFVSVCSQLHMHLYTFSSHCTVFSIFEWMGEKWLLSWLWKKKIYMKIKNNMHYIMSLFALTFYRSLSVNFFTSMCFTCKHW